MLVIEYLMGDRRKQHKTDKHQNLKEDHFKSPIATQIDEPFVGIITIAHSRDRCSHEIPALNITFQNRGIIFEVKRAALSAGDQKLNAAKQVNTEDKLDGCERPLQQVVKLVTMQIENVRQYVFHRD